MSIYKTEQESFWAGEFGNNYILRNKEKEILASNINLFSNVIKRTTDVNSVIEFGANIGLNLLAIKNILPNVDISGVEINQEAFKDLIKICGKKNTYLDSILNFKVDYKRDLSLTKGVLIYINPDYLKNIYELLYSSSKIYICIAEYYNPTPVMVTYRGFNDRLFKRDFAGEMLDKYTDLSLVDYGFVYHRDNNYPQDDITWFLLEKRVP